MLYLLHDSGAEDGLKKLEAIIGGYVSVKWAAPFLPHANPQVTASESFAWILDNLDIEEHSFVVGVGLGGLLAAKVQESLPLLKLTTLCLSAPTQCDRISLCGKQANRVALYSSLDKALSGCCDWPTYTDTAFDVPWLIQHDIAPVKYSVAFLIKSLVEKQDVEKAISQLAIDS